MHNWILKEIENVGGTSIGFKMVVDLRRREKRKWSGSGCWKLHLMFYAVTWL